MSRKLTIRNLYDLYHKRNPDAFIAIQSGEFVTFMFGQAVAINRLLHEPFSESTTCRSVSVHRLRFEELVTKLQMITHQRVLWIERQQDATGYTGNRIIKEFPAT